MKLTKNTHSSVRLEKGGRALVMDPGLFGKPEEAAGANALLVTHEHPDHFNADLVRSLMESNPALELWSQATVTEALSAAFPGRVHTVGNGDAFIAAGFDVKVYGEYHGAIHRDLPKSQNVGFLIDDAIFHPGDALTVPDRAVETLLFPIVAPWSKSEEVVDYIREVNPTRTIDVHNGLLGPAGDMIFGKVIETLTKPETAHLAIGEDINA
ncbi:MBL fold metallo-hydrolase [Streptomyces paludis]|uniref:MBL fold metallo-hydrolase n=1 Tax=Streptomyces paludis TaxID=2282738 RepID=A0A345HVY1_9ACTN|nr:MBL fold metallo-hydrolase [Streptomyces paludis]AXG79172.1 MBL fold metallo-hydrolase [Streptomyces paludis]AXG80855.1 MBL fold metallo-hydrolase [Streptomyces paludis]